MDLKRKLSLVGLSTTGTKQVLKTKLITYLNEVCSSFTLEEVQGRLNHLKLSNSGSKSDLCLRLLEYFLENQDDIYIPELSKREEVIEEYNEPNEQPIIIRNEYFVESKGKQKVAKINENYNKLPKSESRYNEGLQSLHWIGKYFFAENDYENPQFEKYRLTASEADSIAHQLLDSIDNEYLLNKISMVYIYPNSEVVEIFLENVPNQAEAIGITNDLHQGLLEGFGVEGYELRRDDEVHEIMIE